MAPNDYSQEFGDDTQKNLTQVNINAHSDSNEDFTYNVTPEAVKDATVTGVQEDLHVGGLEHGDDLDNKPSLQNKVNSDRNNAMYGNGQFGGSKINREQRGNIIKNIEQDQF